MTHLQKEQGFMVYPAKGIRKLFFKMPVYFWRMGLGSLMPSQFLLLTTYGRKSGRPRHTMVEHNEVNGRIYIASGWGKRPQWVKNIIANPKVTVQTVKRGVEFGHAYRLEEDDELRLVFTGLTKSPFWKPFLDSLKIEYNVEDFLAKKNRLYILAINPLSDTPPAPQLADWTWVWPLVCALGIFWYWRRPDP